MKKTMTLTALLAATGLCAAAGEFPYGVEDMAERHKSAGAVVVSSIAEPATIPKVGDGMPASDSVATVYADFVEFSATTNWAAEAAGIGTGAAGLSLKLENGAFSWMGLTGGGWVALGGAPASEGSHRVTADIDFTPGSGQRKVRYSVDGVALAAQGGATWLPIGQDCEKISEVLLYGACQARSVTAQSGARRLADAQSVTENANMGYTKLAVDVALGDDRWGLSNVVVTVKQGGATVGAVTNAVSSAEGGICTADVSGLVEPGQAYTYDVTLVGGYGATKLAAKAARDAGVNMFAAIDWFGYWGGQFVNASTNGIRAVSMFEFGAEGGGKGTVTPTSPSGEGAVVALAATLTVARALAEGELPALGDGQQFGLTMKRCANGTRSWACNSGSGWLEVAGTGVGTGNGTYDVRIEADYAAATPRVAFSVKTGGAYVRLKNGNAEWFDLPAGAKRLGGVALYGGSVGALNASYRTVGAVPPAVDAENHTISVSANSAVVLSDAGMVAGQSYGVVSPEGKSYHLAWKDGGGKYAVMSNNVLTVKSGTPANNVESYESHVLGLDADDANSIPFIAPVQTADPNRLTLTIPNVRPLDEKETGVAVSYVLTTSETQGGPGEEKKVSGPMFEAALPASGVRYYKVRIELK